ncbi:uncharacterized protein DS421_5g149000 [Arachis hypogaea]|nr:uncharacterized protein DS421_5g149000 [Arachis hypogaea]
MSRVRVSHVYASMVFFTCHAYASGMRTHRCATFQITCTRQVRARIAPHWSSPSFLAKLVRRNVDYYISLESSES